MSTTVLYPSGMAKVTMGTWTHTGGDAAETVAVSGVVFGALITATDSSGAFDSEVRYSVSISGSVSTITIYAQATVASGKFVVFHSG